MKTWRSSSSADTRRPTDKSKSLSVLRPAVKPLSLSCKFLFSSDLALLLLVTLTAASVAVTFLRVSLRDRASLPRSIILVRHVNTRPWSRLCAPSSCVIARYATARLSQSSSKLPLSKAGLFGQRLPSRLLSREESETISNLNDLIVIL